MIGKMTENACLTCSHGKTCKFKDEIQKKIAGLERKEEVISSNYSFKIDLKAHFECPFYDRIAVNYQAGTPCTQWNTLEENDPPGLEQV